jgi:hypothetical protein
MLTLGISRFHPDPIAAIAEAERKVKEAANEVDALQSAAKV